jgi:adenylate cyclase
VAVSQTERFPTEKDSFPRFASVIGPGLALPVAKPLYGHTLLVPDADGVIRRVAVAIDGPDGRYPALGIAAWMVAQSRSTAPRIAVPGVVLGDLRIPVDPTGQMRINFTRPGVRPSVSAADVLRGHASPALLRDKIVFIGTTAESVSAQFHTPLSPGRDHATSTQVQADLVDTLLSNRFLVEQDGLAQINLIFLVALLAGATLPHVGWLTAAGLALVYLLAYLGYGFAKFNEGILVQPLYPGLALGLVFVSTMTYRQLAEEWPQARLRRLFRGRLGPDAMERVLGAVERRELSGRAVRRDVSVLSVDLRDLASLSQSLSPEAEIAVAIQYARLAEEVIFEYEGSILRQMGNRILAVWNLPLSQINHARQAVRAAVELREQIKWLQSDCEGVPRVRVGIGVATGNVVAGPLSTRGSFEYITVGQVVDIAERLAARRDGGIFLNAAAHEQTADEFEARKLEPIRLRRKTDPVQVWELAKPPMPGDEDDEDRGLGAE